MLERVDRHICVLAGRVGGGPGGARCEPDGPLGLAEALHPRLRRWTEMFNLRGVGMLRTWCMGWATTARRGLPVAESTICGRRRSGSLRHLIRCSASRQDSRRLRAFARRSRWRRRHPPLERAWGGSAARRRMSCPWHWLPTPTTRWRMMGPAVGGRARSAHGD